MSERQHFVEGFVSTTDWYKKKPLNEDVSFKIQESGKETTYKAKAIYTFPISRPNEKNLNGRIYTDKLWEKVIKEQQGEATNGLMDHPKDDGSTKDVWCVWRDLRFSEDRKLILCDAYLVGQWGQEVLERLEAGGKIGLSSSGFGEFQEDGTTLNPDTYELERVADYVFNPSYQVFGTQEDLVESTTSNINENTALENSPKEEMKIEEEFTMEHEVKTSPSLEEKSLLLNMKAMFKESKKIENVFDRIAAYEQINSYFSSDMTMGEELKNEIAESIKTDNEYIKKVVLEADETANKIADLEKELADANAEMKNAKADAEEAKKNADEIKKELDDIKAKNEELDAKVKNSCELLESLRTYSNKQKELYKTLEAEKNAMVTVKDYKESIIYSKTLEEELKQVKQELSEARNCAKKEADAEVEEPKDEKAADDVEAKDDAEELKADDEKPEDDAKEACGNKKESFNRDVVDYYNDLEYRNPRVSIIKEDICKCKTLMEAQRTYLRLKGLVEDYQHVTRRTESCGHVYGESQKKNIRREGWV